MTEYQKEILNRQDAEDAAKVPVGQEELTTWQKYQMERDLAQDKASAEKFNWERQYESQSLATSAFRADLDYWYKNYLINKDRQFYSPSYGDEYEQSYYYGSDVEGYDGGLGYGYGLEENNLNKVVDDVRDFTGEKENMSYRRYGGYRRSGGRVSVGRRYVFSRYPRAGFFPKMTRAGMRYVKRRKY